MCNFIQVLGELCPLLKNMAGDKVVGIFTKLLADPGLPYSIHSSVVTCLQKLALHRVVDPMCLARNIDDCLKRELSIVIKQVR